MSKKILAVDDEKHILRLVQINLEKAGYDVYTGSNGQEAVEKTREVSPDLIVMDVMMPIMDGFEALKTLKADPKTATIPVIMLTAKAQDADVFHGWQSGADLYLTFVKRIFDTQSEVQAEGDKTFEVSDDVYTLD